MPKYKSKNCIQLVKPYLRLQCTKAQTNWQKKLEIIIYVLNWNWMLNHLDQKCFFFSLYSDIRVQNFFYYVFIIFCYYFQRTKCNVNTAHAQEATRIEKQELRRKSELLFSTSPKCWLSHFSNKNTTSKLSRFRGQSRWFPLGEFKYLIFSFPRSANKTKRGVEFCHSPQRHENSGESGEQSMLTLSSLWSMRHFYITVYVFFFILFQQPNQNVVTPPNQTRHFARFDKKRNNDVKSNGPTPDKRGKNYIDKRSSWGKGTRVWL